MMDKQAFLNELQKRIEVLEEAEQQDILAEYAQHIDLRVAGGLTEEEAIRDFGDPDQLAAEILRAYHINPSRRSGSAAKAGAKGVLRRCAGAIAGGFGRLAGCAAEALCRFGRSVKGWLFREGKPKAAQQSARAGRENDLMDTEKKEPMLSGIGKTAGSAARGVGRLASRATRLAWNLLLLLCALPFAGMGLLALILLGVLAVLLTQGYPLAGAALCCLGGAACCVSVLGLGSGMIWRGSKAAAAGTAAGAELAGEPADSDLSELISRTAGELRAQEQRKEAFEHE